MIHDGRPTRLPGLPSMYKVFQQLCGRLSEPSARRPDGPSAGARPGVSEEAVRTGRDVPGASGAGGPSTGGRRGRRPRYAGRRRVGSGPPEREKARGRDGRAGPQERWSRGRLGSRGRSGPGSPADGEDSSAVGRRVGPPGDDGAPGRRVRRRGSDRAAHGRDRPRGTGTGDRKGLGAGFRPALDRARRCRARPSRRPAPERACRGRGRSRRASRGAGGGPGADATSPSPAGSPCARPPPCRRSPRCRRGR